MVNRDFYFYFFINVEEDGSYEVFLKKLTFAIRSNNKYFDIPINFQSIEHHPLITQLAKYKNMMDDVISRINSRLDKKKRE